MKTINYKNKQFTKGNGVWLRGQKVGTITEINENTTEREIILTLLTFRCKTITMTLWNNKVFINQKYRGKMEHLLGDAAQELFIHE